MQFNKTNFALAAGFTGAIISFVTHLLMHFMFGGMGMGMRMKMGMMANMQEIDMNYPMMGWGMIIAPIYAFIFAAIAGWLFAYFYSWLSCPCLLLLTLLLQGTARRQVMSIRTRQLQ